MSIAITTTEPASLAPQNLEQAKQFAAMLATSALLPDSLRGKPNDVLVILVTGHELGLSPMQAIRGIDVIKGKVSMSADLSVALVKRHSECVFFRCIQTTATVAAYETERRGEGPTKMSFSIEDANRAGLQGDNWRKYPAAMLRARCSKALARSVYPDLMLGVYDPEELGASDKSTPPPPEIDVTPATQNNSTPAQHSSLKERLLEKNKPKPPIVVDVQPGETEQQAEQRQAEEPAIKYWDAVMELQKTSGMDNPQYGEFLRGLGYKTKAVTKTDVERIKAALAQREEEAF